MNISKLGLTLSFISLAALTACSGGEEYTVSGEVSSAQSVSGPITLEFLEADPADASIEPESVLSVELAELGSFEELVEIDPESSLIVRALADADGDGACTEGELWDEAELTPGEDGTVEAVSLDLAATPCPAPPSAE